MSITFKVLKLKSDQHEILFSICLLITETYLGNTTQYTEQ